jgi:orotate phosphoribosyltransferase
VIVDRSGGDASFDVPFKSALKLSLPTYDPAECPLCAQKLPIDRPGSK